MNPKDDKKCELSQKDSDFAKAISQKYEIPIEKMELYLLNLKSYLNSNRFVGKLIGSIDYKRHLSSREAEDLNFLIRIAIRHVNEEWEIPKFRKYIIAGLTIHHFKLDKYGRIWTEDEFNANPTESAQDYKHYLYDRIKTRFKTVINLSKRDL